MRYALVDDLKVESQPKLRGTCPHCGGETVSKCGRTKVWHWAHKSRESCDPWWENETEWHRDWKDKFPKEWQEISALDEITGERHIADVKTPDGVVVEFQHSFMPPKEMKSREDFYKNMIWIVDGLRNDLDANYFFMGLSRTPYSENPLAHVFEWWGQSKIMHNWSMANSRVFIDFGSKFTTTHVLWRLVFFDEKKKKGVVGPYPIETLVASVRNGEQIGVPYLPSVCEEVE